MGMHKVVDVHAHILLPGVMGSCGAAGPEMGFRENGTEFFRAGDYVLENVRFNNSPFSVPAQRVEKMAAMGIDMQLVSPNPSTYFYHQSKQSAIEFNKKQNDEIAAVCSTHSQLVGAASLPLQDPQASCEELNRAVGTLGLVCSYIGTDVNGLALSDPQFEELWSEHERLGVPVVIHPGPRGSYQKPDAFFDKWELDVIYGFAIDEGLAVSHLLFAQLSFDTAVHRSDALQFLVDTEGIDRVLLGSNFGGWDAEDEYRQMVEGLRLPPGGAEAILGGNAQRIFKI